MMIRTKSTNDPISKRDGLRLFITRYWPRGHNKEECDAFIPSLAPSQRLLKKIQSEQITWAAFRTAYHKEMKKGYKSEKPLNTDRSNGGQRYFIRFLKRLSQDQTITLICDCEPDEPHCHRNLLKALIEK